MKKAIFFTFIFVGIVFSSYSQSFGQFLGDLLNEALKEDNSRSLQAGTYYPQGGQRSGEGTMFFVVSLRGSEYTFEMYCIYDGRNVHMLTMAGSVSGNSISVQDKYVNYRFFNELGLTYTPNPGGRAVYTIENLNTFLDNGRQRWVRS